MTVSRGTIWPSPVHLIKTAYRCVCAFTILILPVKQGHGALQSNMLRPHKGGNARMCVSMHVYVCVCVYLLY